MTGMLPATYDVAVIGGGVIGCAVLNVLTENGLTCVMCERNSDLVAEASSGNSGIVHTGFDAQPGSIEHKCLEMARGLNKDFFDKYKTPFKEIGALIVAWSEKEVEQLPGIVQKAHNAGVTNIYQLSREELREREPNLSQDAMGAVCIPEEGIVDSWIFPVMMAHNAKQQGAQIKLGCNLLSGSQSSNGDWLLITNTGQLRARAVVNCAGLYGDKVEKINKEPSFQIFPRKGQYVVFDNTAGSLLNSIILPVPSEKTKGILLFPTVYGNLVVGPTCEEQSNRDKWPLNNYTSKSLETHALRLLPSLSKHHTVAAYAGLRPASQYRDYQLETHTDRNWITVGGIRSTGLSAATGIATHVALQVQTGLGIFPHVTSQQLLQKNRQSGVMEAASKRLKEIPKPLNGYINGINHDQKLTVHKGQLVYEGASYRITHLLSKLGLDSSFQPNL